MSESNQTELLTRTDHHTRKCLVCKHQNLKEIEEDFMLYEMQAEIARKYNLPHPSLSRHVTYYKLDQQRGANTERMLKIMLSRGFDKGLKIDGKLWIECAKELNRQTGARQKDRENEHDITEEQLEKLAEIRRERGADVDVVSVDN